MKRIAVLVLIIIMGFGSLAAHADEDLEQLAKAGKTLDGIAGLFDEFQKGDVMGAVKTALMAFGQIKAVVAIELIEFALKWTGATNVVPVEKVQSAIEIRGQVAYDLLNIWGILPRGMTPETAVAVRVAMFDENGRVGSEAIYTTDELRASGWLRQRDGSWVAGPNARPLPGRAELRVELTPEGPPVAVVGQPVPIRVNWVATLLKPNGETVDRTSGAEEHVIPASNHPRPMCNIIYEAGLTLPGGFEGAGFVYRYHALNSVGNLGEGNTEEQCPPILGQTTTVSMYKENKKTNSFQLENEHSHSRQPTRLPDPILNDDKDAEEKPHKRTPATNMGGLGGLGGGAPSTGSLRSKIAELEKSDVEDISDYLDLQDYLNEEYRRLEEEELSEVERYRIGLRLISVDEMIKSNNYTPSRLGDAIRTVVNNPKVDSDIIPLFDKLSTHDAPDIEGAIGNYISKLTR